MKVCVLQPDYSQSRFTLAYKKYEPHRNLSHLLPEDQVGYLKRKGKTFTKNISQIKSNLKIGVRSQESGGCDFHPFAVRYFSWRLARKLFGVDCLPEVVITDKNKS